jgi:hypothetical protein
MHSTTTSTDQLKAPLAGVYAITATVAWDSGNGAGARGATLIRNGDINDQVAVSYGPASPTANVTGTNVSGQVRLAAGDTIAVVATNASGAPAVVRGLTAPVLTHLEMTFLSR